jgi:hypothetical protein
MIHSLGEIPAKAQRGYFVYLLDYGWDEPLGEVLFKNFDRMADHASRNNAVVLRGPVGSHFVDDVLSWHQVNGQPADKILPAVLITTKNPHEFREVDGRNRSGYAGHQPMLLVPLRDACKSTSDVAALIERLFSDIRDGKELSNFQIAQELQRGKQGALADALILRPSISGVGVDLKKIYEWFRVRVGRRR